MPSSISIWFDFASTYSYLSAMRIEREADRCGVDVEWQPFLLGPIFHALGWDNSPFVLQPAKGAYMWQDMARQCAKYGLPWRRPTQFPRPSVLAARVVMSGRGEPWIAAFCRAVMMRNFAEDQDIADTESICTVLRDLGLPADRILRDAQSDGNKLKLRENTDIAVAQGVFGAPTFFVGDAMFWGNDRLDDALFHATEVG